MTDRSVWYIPIAMPKQLLSNQSKRDEIVEIASRLFYEQGFGATGIKQIIEEVGIAKGTFYSHFSSKDELGLAWLKARHAIWNRWLDESLKEAGTSGDKILAAFTFLENWLTEAQFRGCAFINTMAEIPHPDHPMRREAAAHKRGLHDHFQRLAGDHFTGLGQSEDGARQMGTVIYLLFEGALVEAQNFHETWPITTARDEIQSRLASRNDL